ncbi:MAG: Rpp14/Pop5 family protein [Candidatus Aenigmatarchaeota archaeon]|jgi:ribonuclease P/MRP protein subunit POP5
MRLKILLPSLRERKRYILFKVFSEEPISYTFLKEAINTEMLKFYGEIGLSKMSLKFLDERWDEKGQIGIIQCNNLSVPNVIAALGLIQRIGESRINIKVLKVSGTIKSLLKGFKNVNQKKK